jgi:hypothetical protein
MKKHIIIFAAAITPLAFFSCSKEKIETQQKDNSAQPNEFAFKPVFKPFINLDSGLVARYEFDANLKEYNGKLADAVPNIPGYDTYTVDRRGATNSAIHFTGRYGVDISKIPLSSNMSVSLWAKYDNTWQPDNYFLWNFWLSPQFGQFYGDNLCGVITTPQTAGVPSGSVDGNWHHLVATYDGKTLAYYVDGKFVGSILNPNQGLPIPQGATIAYQAGYQTALGGQFVTSRWFGSMDDLRFYTRILSAQEVKTLYTL